MWKEEKEVMKEGGEGDEVGGKGYKVGFDQTDSLV